ncbi:MULTISPECIES: hypothetical protein [Nosocomiicoccus]|uniref:hypothetical protein n=1 Tax=Nosocomiicoccus TaxID=489909 RepID=UPI000408497A|nr:MULTISPECIES: hypothetical protein [Nosocomiicoccus]MDK6863502.1 hypothetical protein [Nosocomiicoccus ampullae]
MNYNDKDKTIDEINEEIERQFENDDFEEPAEKKPEYLSLRFIFLLIIVSIIVYKTIQTMT